MRSFGDLMARTLTDRNLTLRAFARRTRTPVSNLSEIIAGRRKPPMARVACWLEELNIPRDERVLWRQLAALAHAKPEVHDLISALEAQNVALQRQAERRQTPG